METVIEIVLFSAFITFWIAIIYCAYKDTKGDKKHGKMEH